MRGLRGFHRVLAAMALLGLVAACAETNLAVETTKVVTRQAPEVTGPYKVGKPYQVGGVWYYPQPDYNYDETGIASWYGPGFHSKATANGETYDENDLTAAHKTLPMPSLVRVTNLENGRSIVVRVNDRGPFVNNRIIDMSRRGAQLLGFEQNGTAKVRVQVMKDESMMLAAKASSQAGGDSFSPAPQAAPAGTVTAQALPPAGGSATPAPVQATQAPKASAIGNVQVPKPTGQVSVVPVKPSNIFIQAGAFLRQQNAQQLQMKLTSLGHQTRITQFLLNQQRFYRVQLGPIGSVEEADALLQKLIDTGHPDARIAVN
ncbi:septal ring lytic transglycosylase RlpA family protein [Dongia rigui]|uniref:Endolytic peptidoglycan transglycosylase RlpA n=1 Tax=Dongia rigui TaxID=940149 RepID=A0ABU5E3R0_9PROT|nr:septal ring lytic transglycosylase RlpA family protein [Dongia rigui]MDY0874260.1 septal ring lytic transglycosylase RlpA family protein [Dongia rigui]